MELFIVGLIIGVILGFYICFKLRPKTVGYLKMVKDENNVPYLFLEMNEDGMSEIHKRSYVTLKVDIKHNDSQ